MQGQRTRNGDDRNCSWDQAVLCKLWFTSSKFIRKYSIIHAVYGMGGGRARVSRELSQTENVGTQIQLPED